MQIAHHLSELWKKTKRGLFMKHRAWAEKWHTVSDRTVTAILIISLFFVLVLGA